MNFRSLLLSCAVAAAVAGASLSPAQGKQMWAKSFLGKKAPALVVEKWIGREPSLKGKYVLLDFWATWCPPCRESIPELNGFHKKFGKKLVVVGLSSEPEEKVLAMTSPSISYFRAIDTKSRTAKAAQVKGIPHAMLIDPRGIVRWEGYPLLEGYELTDKVIAGIVK